jgi:4-amino-4-deoxy-L-arabinose transferase-like glycosyltransferase
MIPFAAQHEKTRRWLVAVLFLSCLVLYVRAVLPFIAPYASGGDAAGYLWSARLFRAGRLSTPIVAPPGIPPTLGPAVFAPLGADVKPGSWDLVPTYPAGLPLHIAFANLFVAEERAVTITLVVAMTSALLLLYRLGREAGLERHWAAAACAVLAFSPLFLFLAVQPMSDVLATAWGEAVIFFAWRARRRARYATLAGMAVGIATLVRPTNALLLAPALAALPFTFDRVIRMLAGGVPAAAFLLLYQAEIHGHPLASGYGDIASAFSFTHFWPRLAHYARWIPPLTGFAALPALGCFWAWRGERRRWRTIATLWVGAVCGFYAFYYHTIETWWYLRFVLPACPAILIAGAATLQQIASRLSPALPRRVSAAATIVVVVSLAALSVRAMQRQPQYEEYRGVKAGDRIYPDAIKWMLLNQPDRRPTLMGQMSGAANYYAPDLRLIRYDRLSPEAWREMREWQARTSTTIDAALADFESRQLFGRRDSPLPCEWRPRGSYRWVTFWECPAPAK